MTENIQIPNTLKCTVMTNITYLTSAWLRECNAEM